MSLSLYMDHHVPFQVVIGQAVKDLELIAKAADPMDMENRVLRLPL